MHDKKGKVGPFYYIKKRIYSDAVVNDQAETYDKFKTWGSHYDYWDKLCRSNWAFQELDYNYFPRGRVAYDYVKNLYYIYLNPKLNNLETLQKIIDEFDLDGLNYIVDDSDEHYQS